MLGFVAMIALGGKETRKAGEKWDLDANKAISRKASNKDVDKDGTRKSKK